jgi:hypothetical protein
MKSLHSFLAIAALTLASTPAFAQARNVPVPASCTPQVNQGLQNLIDSKTTRDVDNIMVCGTAVGKTRVQNGGPHGSHHVTTLAVVLPNGQNIKVQVVVNDALDGIVTANNGDPVIAYGQGYIAHGMWAAGVHDVHCSTHPGADNGWTWVAGVKNPASCPAH